MGSPNTSWVSNSLGLLGLSRRDHARVSTLRGGARVYVRPVRPDDKARLLAGFTALSERSRTFRFCTPKRELNESELRYLTEVDGVDHVALGALWLRDDGPPVPAGIARFVRFPEDPTLAEAAVVVCDALQGEGLGTLLLGKLAEAARARGIERFRCFVLEENEGMKRLLARLDPDSHVVKSGSGTQEFETSLLPRAPGFARASESAPRFDGELAHLVRALSGKSAENSVRP